MGGLGLKVANKSTDIVRILNYEEKVHMRGFNYEMADIYGVKVLCACESAFNDGFAKRVCE